MPYFACIKCGAVSEGKYCDQCGVDGKRPSASARGYGRGSEFERNRAILLRMRPFCSEDDCAKRATVADHDPPRRNLVANGAANPDALIWLKPVCDDCHRVKTGKGR